MATNISDMHGKICLVTGATGGIGKVTAQALAQQGATVIVVSRDPAKCQQTVAEIIQQTGNQNVTAMPADLSSQQDIRRLANEFTAQYKQLDVLVNNAGLLILSRKLSVDGIEMTFALDHLGYFLLTNLLLDSLKASPSARVVSVSSSVHTSGTINFDDLQGAKGYTGIRAYGQAKLANVLFTYELARRLEGTNVTANTLHPGVVATGFGVNNGPLLKYIVRPILNIFSISPEKGAQTSIYLASSPEVAGVTGRYFDKSKAVPSSKESNNVDEAKRLWDVSAQLTGLTVTA